MPPAPAPKPPPRGGRPAASAKAPPPSVGSLLTQFDIRQTLIVLRGHIIPALCLTVVLCALVAWQQMREPKLYSSQAILLVEGQDQVVDTKQVVENEFANEVQMDTTIEQMRSADVIQRVVSSLTPAERALVMTPYFKGPPPITNDQALAGIIHDCVSVGQMRKTMLIGIRVVLRNPDAAALVANRFAAQIIHFLYDRAAAGNDAALVFLRQQADDLKAKVESEEHALQEYRQRYDLVSLDGDQNIIVDRLKTLNGSATAAKLARLAVEARLEQAEAILKGNKDPAQLASIAEFSALTSVQNKIDDLMEKRAVLAETYGRHHPLMEENQREIDSVVRLRNDQIQSALANMRNQRDQAVASERQLAGQLASAEQDAMRLDRSAVDYDVLRRGIDTDKATYTQILNRLNEASITAQLQSVKLRISDRAVVPPGPFAPNPKKAGMITAVLGILILFGYPLTVEMLFARVRNWSDVENYLGTNLLAEIGSVRRVIEHDRAHLVARDKDDAATEEFRALYSQLLLVSKIDPPKTLLITSTVPGEGKSFIASNLASAFVAHGRRVLLVDGDLRRPSQHRNFKVDNKAGILRWIEEGGSLEGDLLADPRLGIVEVTPGLFLLRTGGSSRKLCELMDSGRLTSLLQALQFKFDVVILDTPPSGVFPDALALARVAQELIFICRFNMVTRQQAHAVLQRLGQTGLDIAGIVLNAMPAGRTSSYYYYGYGHYRSRYYAKYYKAKEEGAE